MNEFTDLLQKYGRANMQLGKQTIFYEYSVHDKQEIYEMMEIIEAELLELYKEIVNYVSQLNCENNCEEL